ncbi:MAG: hypothetical protein ABIR79_23325 [Candidatus Binatia bacterium]
MRESQPEAARARPYTDLLGGRITPKEVSTRAEADTRYGVPPSPMTLMR